MINPKMVKGRHIQSIVTGQGITVDNTVRHNHFFYNRHDGFALVIGNDLRVHTATSLQEAKDWDFASSTATSFAFSAAAKITFLNFNRPDKGGHIRQMVRNDLSKTMVQLP